MPALIVDPALQARVIRQFNLRGELAPFNLTENVVPVFDIGTLTGIALDPRVVTTLAGSQGVRVGTIDAGTYVPTADTVFDDGDVTNRGVTVNPAAGAVISDSGARTSGIHVVHAFINWTAAILDFAIEWRNAANDTTIATWPVFVGTGLPYVHWGPFVFNVVGSERFRVITPTGGTGTADATVMEHRIAVSVAQ